jgi:hypothetical protein
MNRSPAPSLEPKDAVFIVFFSAGGSRQKVRYCICAICGVGSKSISSAFTWLRSDEQGFLHWNRCGTSQSHQTPSDTKSWHFQESCVITLESWQRCMSVRFHFTAHTCGHDPLTWASPFDNTSSSQAEYSMNNLCRACFYEGIQFASQGSHLYLVVLCIPPSDGVVPRQLSSIYIRAMLQ